MATKRKNTGDPAQEREPLLIYVHGIGLHAPADELKLEWDLALFGKDLGARSRMAWWCDLVRPEAAVVAPATPGAKAVKRVAGKAARGAGQAAAAARRATARTAAVEPAAAGELDIAALLARAGVPAGDAEAERFVQGLLHDVGGEAPPVARGPGRKVLPLPGFLRKPLARAFLEGFITDTAAYFFQPGLRERIRERLAVLLRGLPAGRPVTIVAHSQGSIVAYEVLAALSQAGAGGAPFELAALVTLGSPLGLREVQDFLEPDSLEIPARVTRWFNFADPLDVVALDKGLGSDFHAAPPGTTTVRDELIVNSASRRLAGFNPHSAVGYLAHPSVRRTVAEAMHMDTVGRFVIARDVAELLAADDSVRRPVLIEALEPGYAGIGESAADCQAREKGERVALDVPVLRLEDRIGILAERLRRDVVSDAEAAEIDPLRRFVAARLTASELRRIGREHLDLRVYAVWRSARKSKHTGRSMRALKADAAMASFGADGAGITWAVLDTGIQGNHPHFAPEAAGGVPVVKEVWDCTRPGEPRRIELADARDKDGHGTHVAGIVAGRRRDDGGAERGVAPRARLVVYKVLKDDGEGEDAWIIKALDHIASRNAQVTDGLAVHGINLSLGGPFDHSVYGCGFSPLCAELRRLWRDGVLVVVSSGNEGTLEVSTPGGELEVNAPMSIGDPANLEECIAVGSVHADRPHLYGISAFSSRGPTADGRMKPDVVAPGERISSCNAAFRAGVPGSLYRQDSGTSMAAPHVSGLLAAFLSARPEFRGRPDEVKRVLLDSCIDLGRDRYHQGRGLPNLMQMLLGV